MPDRWEASYQLGELLFHYGALLGKPAAMQRARTAFRRSLEGDSAFAPATLTSVRLIFDRTPAGVVVLDDLGSRK